MNKKVLLSVSFLLVLNSVLCSCDIGTTNYDFDAPTYETTKEINIGVWNGSHYDLSDEELSNLQEAGVNLLVGTYTKETSMDDFLDRCANYNLSVVADQRPWNETIPSYIDKENFLGFCVYDEPKTISDLIELTAMKQKYDAKMGEKLFFVNLNPNYAGIQGNYESYLDSYLWDCGLDMVSFDNYSLLIDKDTEKVYTREDYLYNFDVCAYYAEEKGVPLWYTLLTSGHLVDAGNYIDPSAKDLEWQMNLAMTYGATYLLHYIYSSSDPSYQYPIVDMNGNPTDTYYKVKEADAAIRSWDHIYMNYHWLGTSAVKGTNGETGLFDYLKYDIAVDKYGGIESASATEDVIIGQFKDDDNRNGYMVTNVTNPSDNKTSNISVTFDSDYKGVLVVQDGKESIVNLDDGKFSTDIPAGEAVFLIPLKVKK